MPRRIVIIDGPIAAAPSISSHVGFRQKRAFNVRRPKSVVD
jgi:hypothetical protein